MFSKLDDRPPIIIWLKIYTALINLFIKTKAIIFVKWNIAFWSILTLHNTRYSCGHLSVKIQLHVHANKVLILAFEENKKIINRQTWIRYCKLQV